jgi:hypothetical protein
MMGHREEMKGGIEVDCLTKARRFYHWSPGTIVWVKRKYNKRVRRNARIQVKRQLESQPVRDRARLESDADREV